jgi:hypothetical protein
MDTPQGMEANGPFEARYLAFLETILQLRPRLHRYCARMTGSVQRRLLMWSFRRKEANNLGKWKIVMPASVDGAAWLDKAQ